MDKERGERAILRAFGEPDGLAWLFRSYSSRADQENSRRLVRRRLDAPPDLRNLAMLRAAAEYEPAEMPDLDRVWRDLGAKGLAMLAITDEDSDVVKEFATERGLRLPVVLDRERKAFDIHGITGIPVTVVLDRRGNTVRVFTTTLLEEELREALRHAGL